MPAVDITENYIRLRQKDPGGFAEGSFRMITLDAAGGIKAVIGKIKGEATTTVQSYLFAKDKWDAPRASAWVDKHRGGHEARDVAARWGHIIDTGIGADRVRVAMKPFMLSAIVDDDDLSPYLCAVQSIDDGGAVEMKDDLPVAFRVFAYGEHTVVGQGAPDDTIRVDEEDADEVMEKYRARGLPRLVIDYDHATYSKTATGPRPAAGWFSLEKRKDGLWASAVEWTDTARKHLTAREYRHFSPTGAFEAKTGHLRTITTLALTNVPATNSQPPLVASENAEAHAQETEMKVRELLGMSVEATDDEVEARITELLGASGKLDEATKAIESKDAEIAEIRASMSDDKVKPLVEFQAKAMESVGLTADAKEEEYLAAIVTLKAKAPEAEKVVALQAKVADLEKFREDVRIERLMASVDEHIGPANKADVEMLARSVPEDLFMKTVKSMPNLKGAPDKPITTPASTEVLTGGDKEYLASVGIAPDSDRWKAFEAEKKRMASERSR